jgi:glycosyltransferase involved in cell wall biosynthesis
MKIVINAASAKVGGAVTYITNVLRALPGPESGHEFEVYLPPETARRQGGLGRNVRVVVTTIGHASWWRRLWWEQVTLRARLRQSAADLLFSTGNFGMFLCPVRQLVLVCNALYFSKLYRQELVPRQSLKKQLDFRLRRWLCCRSVRAADVVITPTQATLAELREFVQLAARRAVVNPYGVEEKDFLPPPEPSLYAAGNAPVVRLVYVSLYYEHKNLTTLLRAMRLLNQEGKQRFRLVTTVNPGWQGAASTTTYREDLALARESAIAPWVEFVGPWERDAARQLYREADIFVFPSLSESFGHPMVEAMAAGLPIVAADTPVNREICGDAAEYFPPLSAEDLAGKVRRLASNLGRRQRLGAAGKRRATAAPRWDEHVRKVLAAAVP